MLGCFIENLCHITKVKMSVPIAGIRQVVIWQKNKGQFPALILRDPLVLKHSSALMDYEGKQATNYEVGRRMLNL